MSRAVIVGVVASSIAFLASAVIFASSQQSTRPDGTSGGEGFRQLPGAPEPLQSFCCPDYVALIKRAVEANWRREQGNTGTTTLKFTIEKNGQISKVEVDKSSGHALLDTEALWAVRAAQFPPLPTQYSNPTLTVNLGFVYGGAVRGSLLDATVAIAAPTSEVTVPAVTTPDKGATTPGSGVPVGTLEGSASSPSTSSDSPARTGAQSRPAPGRLGDALRNLDRFVQSQTFNNPGSNSDPSSSIAFDTAGVEFGPWVRQFVAHVRRNWRIPPAAMNSSGHVVIRFTIAKNGRISDVGVIQPSGVEQFNRAAHDAIVSSSPVAPLPADYPRDSLIMTVTFFYNERPPAP